MKTAGAMGVVLLAGCTTVTRVPLPDGRLGYVIDDCSKMADCYIKAAEVCGGKYELIDRNGKSGVQVSGAEGSTSAFMTSKYSMTVRCLDPPAP